MTIKRKLILLSCGIACGTAIASMLAATWLIVSQTRVGSLIVVLAVTAIVILLAMVALVLLFVERLTRPIHRLTQVAEDITRGQLDAPEDGYATDRSDELGVFARAFEVMRQSIREKIETIELQNNALQESENHLREAQRVARIGSFEGEISKHDLWWSAELFHLFGLEPELFAPTKDGFFALLHPDDRDSYIAALNSSLESGKRLKREFRAKHSSGAWRRFETLANVTFDDQGETLGLRGTVQDITERKQAEEERLELRDQLRQSQKMEAIGQLTGGVAHDFNNLLTVILGNSEMLLSATAQIATTSSEGLLRASLEQIQSAGTHAAALTRQLLAFSRRDITKPEVVDTNRIVGNMEGMLRRLIGEHIQLDVRLGTDKFLVYADPGQIEQIMMNLVVNAADAMPEGGHLEIRVEDAELNAASVADHVDSRPGRYAVLCVIDNGTGMAPETLENMFEPFFTTKPVGKGTGLGLATVYGNVKQLGGLIQVDSKPGVGSTFTVYVPIVEGEETNKELDRPVAGSCAGETLLVCEDEDMVREIMCEALRDAGYTVIEAENGEQALAAATNHVGSIELLISDVLMPGLSGIELAERLTRDYPDTPVLFVSGYTADRFDPKGVLGEAAEILQKPFGPTTLLRRVHEVLNAEPPQG